ncbi:MAG: baseplate J/gp47 family protein [Aggregatilineales bacterium]
MRLQIIQLEPYDDVASVRDRLAFIRADRVLLVWPKAGAVLTRKLDLVLVQRAADRGGMRLALVTHDRDVVESAADLHISVFGSVDAGSTIRWKRSRNKAFAGRSQRPAAALDRYELMDAASRLRRVSPEQRRRSQITRIGAAVGLVLALLIGAYVVFPSASVHIYPARDQLTTTVKLIADPTIAIENVDTGHVPATLAKDIVVERRATISTSGNSDVPNTIASGTVIFSNQTAQPIVIPKGTIVSTLDAKNPVRFQTTADALVDANGKVEVTIQAMADSAGPIGNIDAGLIASIDGTLAKSLAVRNPNPTQGGTLRSQKLVMQADRDKLLALVRDQIVTSAIADIALTPTQFIIPGSIKILEERPEWTTFSAFVGDPTDTLTLTLRTRIQALIVDELPARKAAYASLARQLGNRQIVLNSVTYHRGRVDPIGADGQATFLLTASADAVTQIDPDQARDQIVGQSIGAAQGILQANWLLDPLRPPEIDVSLGFLGRLPILPIRINVSVDF